MHQHGYRHHLDEGLATMLADIGLLLLAALGVAGLVCRLGVRQQCCESATFRASREFIITPAVFLHHNLVSIVAAIGCKLQGLHPILRLVVFRQAEIRVPAHRLAALWAVAVVTVLHLLLENQIIDPA